jgi:hypothetical protein
MLAFPLCYALDFIANFQDSLNQNRFSAHPISDRHRQNSRARFLQYSAQKTKFHQLDINLVFQMKYLRILKAVLQLVISMLVRAEWFQEL